MGLEGSVDSYDSPVIANAVQPVFHVGVGVIPESKLRSWYTASLGLDANTGYGSLGSPGKTGSGVRLAKISNSSTPVGGWTRRSYGPSGRVCVPPITLRALKKALRAGGPTCFLLVLHSRKTLY